MHGISQFYDTFFDKSPFKNVEKPAKPKISDAERTGISDKEHHAISSNTDANSVMIIVDKKGNKVEPNKKPPTKMSPLEAGGYEGGGDVAGAYYVPTGQMYADMFAKIGQAVADIDANKKKKEEEDKKEGGIFTDALSDSEFIKTESMFNPDGTLKKSASERAAEGKKYFKI
jgi:uncharacterized lipoprotein NlpE involved in copper resistance